MGDRNDGRDLFLKLIACSLLATSSAWSCSPHNYSSVSLVARGTGQARPYRMVFGNGQPTLDVADYLPACEVIGRTLWTRLEKTDSSFVLAEVGDFGKAAEVNITEHPILVASYAGEYRCKIADCFISTETYQLDIIAPISRSAFPASLTLDHTNVTYTIPCSSNGRYNLIPTWTFSLFFISLRSLTRFSMGPNWSSINSELTFEGDDPNIVFRRNASSGVHFNATCTISYVDKFDCIGVGSTPPRPGSVIDRCAKATQPLSTTTTVNIQATHCPWLDTIFTDSFITPSTPNTRGTSVMLPCDQMYCPRNVMHQFTCLPNGFWTFGSQFTHCEQVNSATIEAIPRSAIGSSVTAVCRDDHASISGPKRVECLDTGIWSPLPTCAETRCKATKKSTINIIEGLAIGETATVTCRYGYGNMSGSSTVQCLPGGKWSSLP
eukprot:scpid86525/ scgid8019/ 